MGVDVRAELGAFDPELPIERAWTPPSSWYTAPELFELERRAVFGRTWHPVARLADLAQPGAYSAGCLFGEPYVVLRDQTGELRAFHNTCRHKGREVVQGTGRADELVCGYHAWTYGLDGRLSSAPRMAGIEAFERGQMSLRPLAVEAFGPWAFLNLDVDAARGAPLAAGCPELASRLEETSWASLTYIESTTWDIGCNWKVYVDNYLDGGYHIPHMHPSLDAQLDMSTYRTEVFERSSIQTSDPAPEPDAGVGFDARARIGTGAIYAWLWPNFMLNRYGPCLDSNYVVPLGPDHCRVVYDFFFEGTGEDAQRFAAESIAQSAVTQQEDIAICESVQRGLRSQGYDRGRYAPRVEQGEHHFHRLLAAALRAGLG